MYPYGGGRYICTYIKFLCYIDTYIPNARTQRNSHFLQRDLAVIPQLPILTLMFVRSDVHEWSGANPSGWNTNIKKSQMHDSDPNIDWLPFQET